MGTLRWLSSMGSIYCPQQTQQAAAWQLPVVSVGFRVWGLGFGVWGLGFGVWGLWPQSLDRTRLLSRKVLRIHRGPEASVEFPWPLSPAAVLGLRV